LDYTYGIGKIYTAEEIEKAKQSPSFEREYNLKYLGKIGNVFHTKDIEAAIEKGRKYNPDDFTPFYSFTSRSMGIDPAYGSSAFGIVVTEWADGKVQIMHAEEYHRPDYNEMIYENIYRVSSFVSFFSIWVTTAILMNRYREKLVNAIVYWVILSIPFVYFLITYFYQFFLANILSSYLAVDPVTVSIIIGAFISLSKALGGLIFGVAFWKISRIVSYERNIRTYMFFSGWGIFLIFTANQATTLIVSPYPPFGLATLTVLNMGAFLMLIGIYNSARLVSTNNELRRFIHKQALESRLLSMIGTAEMEKELQKTIAKISHDIGTLEEDKKIDIKLDEDELTKYVDLVAKEVKHKDKNIKRH
jgi:hypothetical protein